MAHRRTTARRANVLNSFKSLPALALAAGLSLLLGAPSVWADARGRELESLARFQASAGPPVSKIRSFTLSNWRSLGPEHLAVWRGTNKVWLLRVRPLCHGLEFARTIGFTSSASTISARFDRIVFRDGVGAAGRTEQCVIAEIREVDHRKLREAERLARSTPDQDSGGT
jgi:hypothetical protein